MKALVGLHGPISEDAESPLTLDEVLIIKVKQGTLSSNTLRVIKRGKGSVWLKIRSNGIIHSERNLFVRKGHRLLFD